MAYAPNFVRPRLTQGVGRVYRKEYRSSSSSVVFERGTELGFPFVRRGILARRRDDHATAGNQGQEIGLSRGNRAQSEFKIATTQHPDSIETFAETLHKLTIGIPTGRNQGWEES